MPGYDVQVTSAYRSPQDQQRLKDQGYKPAADSAHLYNLAKDYVLINKATGQYLKDVELEKVFKDFIKPNWIGYTYFDPSIPGKKGAHIHGNIDRSWSEKAKYAALAAGVISGAFALNKFIKNLKGKGVK